MGVLVDPRCRSCGHAWSNELLQGTMLVGVYRCQSCGTSARIGAPELQAAGLVDDAPWALPKKKVRAVLGECECGGEFSWDAPLRCPLCRSTDVDQGTITALVD